MENVNAEVQTEELKGLITLKSVYSKEQKLIIQPTKNSSNNWYLGVERLSDDQKKQRDYVVEPNIKLIIKHGMSFDMNDPIDRLNWQWVKHCPAVALSFEDCQKTPDAMFYVENEEREALQGIERIEITHKAVDYVLNDAPSNYQMRARVLGLGMEGESPLVIKKDLLKLAHSYVTAGKVVNAYENKALSLQLLYFKARDAGIIQIKNGAHMMGTTPLGVSEESVMEFLKSPENKHVVMQLEKETTPELYPPKEEKKKVVVEEPQASNPPEEEFQTLEDLVSEDDDGGDDVAVSTLPPKVETKKTVAKKTTTRRTGTVKKANFIFVT